MYKQSVHIHIWHHSGDVNTKYVWYWRLWLYLRTFRLFRQGRPLFEKSFHQAAMATTFSHIAQISYFGKPKAWKLNASGNCQSIDQPPKMPLQCSGYFKNLQNQSENYNHFKKNLSKSEHVDIGPTFGLILVQKFFDALCRKKKR